MKDAVIRIGLVVILLVLYVFINNGVSDRFWSQDGMQVALERGSLWAGMGRWMAHVNWMRLLQSRAMMSGKPDKNVAEALFRRYDIITDQDPFQMLAYEHGGIELATMGQPQLGLKLLDKGIEVAGKDNWKLPSYAARIASFYFKDDPQKDTYLQQSEKYLEQARQVNGHPFYIETSLVRLRGAKLNDDPVAMAKLWREIGGKGVPSPDWGTGTSPSGQMIGGPEGGQYSQHAQEKVIAILRDVRAKAQQASGDQKQTLEKQAAEIEEIVKSMLSAKHVCGYCFAEFVAGDKFCPNCGRGVEVFGVCPKCNTVVEAGASFCSHCGAEVPKGAQNPK